jgi:hypothetical protein
MRKNNSTLIGSACIFFPRNGDNCVGTALFKAIFRIAQSGCARQFLIYRPSALASCSLLFPKNPQLGSLKPYSWFFDLIAGFFMGTRHEVFFIIQETPCTD